MLGLFDDILISSFCDDDESIPILNTGSLPQLCAFCGGELFRSGFSCAGQCKRNQSPPGDGIILCASCYVDGRTCECAVMAPCRLQPLSELLKFRDNVCRLLLDLMGDTHDGLLPQGRM